MSLDVKKELYKRVVVLQIMFGIESSSISVHELNKLDFVENKCLRSMFEVNRENEIID